MDGGIAEEVGVVEEKLDVVSVDESEHPVENRNAPGRIMSRFTRRHQYQSKKGFYTFHVH